MAGILGSSLLVIIGIKVVTMKTTVIATLKKRNLSEDSMMSDGALQNDLLSKDGNESSKQSFDVDSHVDFIQEEDSNSKEKQKQRIIKVFMTKMY